MFDKSEILYKVIDELELRLQTLVKVAHAARDEATHEDAKAENKYDTRGLEASYLAGAQARRAKELQDAIEALRKIPLKNYMEGMAIEATALIEVEVNGEDKKWFFMLPQQGGIKVEVEDTEIQTITPESPLGKNLYQNTVGHGFEMKNKLALEYEITEVW